MSLDTLTKANIFFFVTTIAVVIITIAFALITYFVIKALMQARRALKEVEDHVGDTTEDLRDMLFDIRESAAYRLLFRRKKRIHNGSKQ